MKRRTLRGPLLPLIRRLNEVRRAHPALQRYESLRWLDTHSDELIAYAKREGDDVVITVVNLDPVDEQEGLCIVPPELGLPEAFTAVDLLSDATFRWRTGRNYVGLPPGGAHVVAVASGARGGEPREWARRDAHRAGGPREPPRRARAQRAARAGRRTALVRRDRPRRRRRVARRARPRGRRARARARRGRVRRRRLRARTSSRSVARGEDALGDPAALRRLLALAGVESPCTDVRPAGLDQTNSAAVVDDAYVLKLYRRIEDGPAVEAELLDALERGGFDSAPRLRGRARSRRRHARDRDRLRARARRRLGAGGGGARGRRRGLAARARAAARRGDRRHARRPRRRGGAGARAGGSRGGSDRRARFGAGRRARAARGLAARRPGRRPAPARAGAGRGGRGAGARDPDPRRLPPRPGAVGDGTSRRRAAAGEEGASHTLWRNA